jgi:predicted nucleic acid-binding protein
VARLEVLILADLVDAYRVFCRYDDKAWSFTDCTSFVLMQRMRIVEAFALDEHFRQMPGIAVVDLNA